MEHVEGQLDNVVKMRSKHLRKTAATQGANLQYSVGKVGLVKILGGG